MPMTEKQYAAIYTLPSSSEVRLPRFADNGAFIDDLKDYGLTTLFTNRHTFETGEALRADSDHGDVAFTSVSLSIDGLSSVIGSIHSRVLPILPKPAAAEIPLLNNNEVKQYSADKYTLYTDILQPYQVQTELLPITPDSADRVEDIIETLSARHLVMKPNNGFRGASINKIDVSDLHSTLAELVDNGKTGSMIVQPLVEFGPLPQEITGHGTRERSIVRDVRKNNLLNELRLYCVKNGESTTYVPTLRVVEDKAGSMGDDDIYVDINVENELYESLTSIASDVMTSVSEKAGDVQHILAAIDFFFTKDGQPRVMEANLRAPGLPRSDTNAYSARLLYPAIARTLYDMSKETK